MKSIELVELMNNTHNCTKLISGEPGLVVPTSYIVMMKKFSNMSEIVSEYILCHAVLCLSMVMHAFESRRYIHKGVILAFRSFLS